VPVPWVNVVPAWHVLVRLANLAAVHCRDGPAGDPLDVTANVAVHTRDDGPLHSVPTAECAAHLLHDPEESECPVIGTTERRSSEAGATGRNERTAAMTVRSAGLADSPTVASYGPPHTCTPVP
jgi:hypothetical protein